MQEVSLNHHFSIDRMGEMRKGESEIPTAVGQTRIKTTVLCIDRGMGLTYREIIEVSVDL